MLKRYDISLFTILMLLLAASLVSCEKEINGPASNQSPIVFGDVETRAVVESVESMETGGFGVFGYVSDVTDPLFDNVNVTWDADEEVWTYRDPKYWIPSHIHHFFAYYPYSAATTADSGVSGVQALDDNSGFKLNFTTPETKDMIGYDLLSAYTAVDTGANDFDASKSVPMKFGHEMVNVNLKIWSDYAKHQNDKIRVKKVALSNVTWSGTLTKTAGGSTSWTSTTRKPLLEGTVENPEAEIGAATKTSSGITPGPDAVPCTPFKNGLLLIPATISGVNAVSLSIVYELQLKGANENTWSEYSHDITLPATTWKAGTQITYNVLLSNIVDITFYYISTSVASWGTPQVGGTIIIK